VHELYTQSMSELDFTTCDLNTVQTTINNLDMAAYIAQTLCTYNNTGNVTLLFI